MAEEEVDFHMKKTSCIRPYNFKDKRNSLLRVVFDLDGTAYYCGYDLAIMSGYSAPTKAVQRSNSGLYPAESVLRDIEYIDSRKSGSRRFRCFTEENALRFLKRKPDTQEVRDWFTAEVIPKVRQISLEIAQRGYDCVVGRLPETDATRTRVASATGIRRGTTSRNDKMMTIRQVAKTGILSEYFLRSMLKAGKLPGCYIGNRFMVNYELLLDQINEDSRRKCKYRSIREANKESGTQSCPGKKIAVIVRGGMVQAVYSTSDEVEVEVIDLDPPVAMTPEEEGAFTEMEKRADGMKDSDLWLPVW